jgi:hypothetical protein
MPKRIIKNKSKKNRMLSLLEEISEEECESVNSEGSVTESLSE